ncbi:MAG TPA: NAD(P)H-dependent glycerol-3-phosphate dehydrogenase [bacterium]|nr:NAD(P)H-dependent glycerol-3-phosphate dehydrogenase [bacterium]
MRVTVLCAGSWGITLAVLLHQQGHAVRVWEYDPAVVEVLVRTRAHPHLPGLVIPPDLSLATDLAGQVREAEMIVCAVPAAHLRQTARSLAPHYQGQPVVVCTKGIEQGTHALPLEVLAQELGAAARGQLALLSGPSHAEEVCRGLPTAVAAAAEQPALAERVREAFMTPRFRVYTQSDVVGVQLGAALKNVIAISCGISDGLGFGDNAKAGLITRGLSEILRLGLKRGARAETFFGLAGLGDLVVTCMSRHSRNWRFGSLVGAGATPQAALAQVGMVVEGYYTVRAAVELAAANLVEMPITQAVGEVLFAGKPAADAVASLMLRDPKSEMAR